MGGANWDSFTQMLVWSAVVHVLCFTSLALGSYLSPSGSLLAAPDAQVYISIGASGPLAGMAVALPVLAYGIATRDVIALDTVEGERCRRCGSDPRRSAPSRERGGSP